jgi:hypothetical protein
MSESTWEAIKEFLGAIPIIFFLIVEGCTPPPSDDTLIETFHSNRAQFEQLREKLCEWPVDQTVWNKSELGPEHASPEVSPADMKWFVATMAAIKAERVAVIHNPCRIGISVWAVGLADGDYKSYRFGLPIHEDVIELSSLDDVDRSSNEIAIYRRRIEGDWWLEFQHWP